MVEEVNVTTNHSICSKECQFSEKQEGDPALLSKWRKSAALFQPSCKNHLPAEFSGKKSRSTWKQSDGANDREVLDAAEALTYLSRGSSNRI